MTRFDSLIIRCLFAATLGLFLVSAQDVLAHGDDHAHMQEMVALKERIPEQYHIMDRTPVTPSPESLARGARLYTRHCAACHGPWGEGDGLAAAALPAPPASFLDREHSDFYGPGEKYWIIGEGIVEAAMPGFSDQLSPRDRWDLVNFILELQRQAETKGNED